MFSGLGVSLFIAGLVTITLVWVVLRMLPRSHTAQADSAIPWFFLNLNNQTKRSLFSSPGDGWNYLSDRARSYFNLRENEPYDLERLARYVRPSDEFLDLCAVPAPNEFPSAEGWWKLRLMRCLEFTR
jgi:hypothetical protein